MIKSRPLLMVMNPAVMVSGDEFSRGWWGYELVYVCVCVFRCIRRWFVVIHTDAPVDGDETGGGGGVMCVCVCVSMYPAVVRGDKYRSPR